jgi:anti-sigma factor RsiW
VNVELTHREAKSLFGAFVDEELEPPKEESLKAHLDDCAECRTGWELYARVVKSTRTLERQKAPPGLATVILRRVRRRRIAARTLRLTHAQYALPAEIIIPVVLAAAVAALLFISAA